ncbi:hypothetical protein [Agarilytica rhodophyticola]|nr:hypothetical protein [Agarilytica rhodophyticola]
MTASAEHFTCRRVKEYTPDSKVFGKSEVTILSITFFIAYTITSVFI